MKTYLMICISVFVISVYGQAPPDGTFNKAPAPTITFISGNDDVCSGDSIALIFEFTNGPVSVGYTANSMPYVVSMSTSPYVLYVSPLVATDYILTSVSNSSCSGTIVHNPPTSYSDVSIDVDNVPTVNVINLVNPGCFGYSNGSAEADISGGAMPIGYLWYNGVTSNTNVSLYDGTHEITVTDANGCEATTSFTVVQPQLLELVVVSPVTNVNCAGGSSGAATVYCQGGTGPYDYIWSDGQVGQNAVNLSDGTYTVTATDLNGCMDVISVTIGLDPLVMISISSYANTTCFGDNDGIISTYTEGGATPYSYEWDYGPTNPDVTGLVAGTYTVTVTDDNGCEASVSQTIDQPTEVNASFSFTNVSCDGLTDGTASVSMVSGGTSPYSYEWDGGATTSSVDDLTTGTHEVTMTDANGCEANGFPHTFIVEQHPEPTVIASSSGSGTSCGGSALDLTATASGGDTYTYLWNDGSMDSINTVTPLVPTVYIVTVTNNHGCEAIDSVTVNVHELPVLTISIPLDICASYADFDLESYITALPSGGNFLFSGDAIMGSSMFTMVLSQSGINDVHVQYTGPNGCIVEQDLQINVHALPDPQLDLSVDEICLNAGDITITGEYPFGGFYSGSGIDSAGIFTPTLAGTGPTTITYTLVDGYGCSGSVSDVINVVAPEVVSINLPSTEFCSGEGVVDFTVSETGGDARIYGPTTPTTGVPLTGDGSYVVYVDMSNLDGNYTIVYNLTASACGGTDTVEFVVHQTPDVSLSLTGGTTLLHEDSTLHEFIVNIPGGVLEIDGVVSGYNYFPYQFEHGEHLAVYTFDDGLCSGTDSLSFFVIGPDGIEELDVNSLINIFPNPVANILNIAVDESINVSGIQITSVNGKIVYNTDISNEKHLAIDVSRFTSGMYLVRFVKDGVYSPSKRFIKK